MSTDDNQPHSDHGVAGNSPFRISSDRITCLSQKTCDADINAKTDNALLSKEFQSELPSDRAGDTGFEIFSAVTYSTRHILCYVPICMQMNVKTDLMKHLSLLLVKHSKNYFIPFFKTLFKIHRSDFITRDESLFAITSRE